MGVLNVTPDSFSDGGQFLDPEHAVERANEMVAQGADIIDVGGQSTRPGSSATSEEKELERVLPVVERLSNSLVSVDTTNAIVAERSIAAGAKIINDVSALQVDPQMANVIKVTGSGVVLMHMQGNPETMQNEPHYQDVVSEVKEFLKSRIEFCISHGIKKSQVAVDPGIGFGKSVEHNLELLARLGELRDLECPLLVGTSRKSFIGKLLERGVKQRIWGTSATVAWAISQGAGIVRVHDVSEISDVVKMCDAIRTYG